MPGALIELLHVLGDAGLIAFDGEEVIGALVLHHDPSRGSLSMQGVGGLNSCSAPRSRASLAIQPRVHGLDHFFRIECAAQKLIDGFCLRHWIGDEFIVINGQNGKVRLFFEPVLHARHLAKKDLRQSFFAQGGARFALPLQHHPLRSEHFCHTPFHQQDAIRVAFARQIRQQEMDHLDGFALRLTQPFAGSPGILDRFEFPIASWIVLVCHARSVSQDGHSARQEHLHH